MVKEGVVKALDYQLLGEVQLKGFDKYKAKGHLITLHAKVNDDRTPIPIKLVVCTHVYHDCLLSLADYQKLLAQDSETSLCDQASANDVGLSVIQNVDVDDGSSVGLSGTPHDNDDIVNDSSNTAEQSPEDDLSVVMSNVNDASKFISEQRNNKS